MRNSKRKVVLVGTGMVGMSFVYSMINQAIASDYVLIDINKEAAIGNAWDVDDAKSSLTRPFSSITAGSYEDCSDADLIVITAGRPQLPGETRLDMVSGNAKIMKTIAEGIKSSGFSGITLIASNPVDVMTQVYQEVTGFDQHKVVGSGTTLDSSRFQRLIADELNIHPQSVNAYIIGEHGDSSLATVHSANISLRPLLDFVTQEKCDEIWHKTVRMAYEIIERKRATYYGIGASLTKLARIILADLNQIVAVGAKLNGEYGQEGVYIGVPAVLGAHGWRNIVEIPLSEKEEKKFHKSVSNLKEAVNTAREAIK